jgi:hypothetical protein
MFAVAVPARGTAPQPVPSSFSPGRLATPPAGAPPMPAPVAAGPRGPELDAATPPRPEAAPQSGRQQQQQCRTPWRSPLQPSQQQRQRWQRRRLHRCRRRRRRRTRRLPAPPLHPRRRRSRRWCWGGAFSRAQRRSHSPAFCSRANKHRKSWRQASAGSGRAGGGTPSAL